MSLSAHEEAVLRAVADRTWHAGWQSGVISARSAESAKRRLVAAKFIVRTRGGYVLTERGQSYLAPMSLPPFVPYRPPAPLPVRDGSLRYTTLPSVYAGRI